ncbi:hypothetical protein [Alkalithermobacter paradoxus]|uniref:DUF4340 domain-containing protein n=1 Tax=Alkalithermobacter paradoxus TaxID=29349 RepID=A0A1V4I635_9FIRM|nr:hypothetical protein CLOTH_17400 [[Clostridium] thermoalcaliphilum]
MYKKLIIACIIIFVLVFAITFSLTYIKTKEEAQDTKSTIASRMKDVPLINLLKDEVDIKVSGNRLEDMSLNEDIISELNYYIEKMKKLDDKVTVQSIIKGEGEKVKFTTDYKNMKIEKSGKEEYYEIPSQYSNELEQLFERGMFTSFDITQNNKIWNKVEIEDEYSKQKKELQKSKFKEFSDNTKLVAYTKEHKIVSSNNANDNFYITIGTRDNEIYLQLMGRSVLGVYYKAHRSYYQIQEDLYDYLSQMMRNTKPSQTKQDQSNYDWVEEIEIKDIVNNINSVVKGKDAKDLVDFLFNKHTVEGTLGQFEEKRYELTLKGKGRTQNIIAYENNIQLNGKVYQVKSVDIIISAYANTP